VELPEKQGLKHGLDKIYISDKESCSGTSRKTRIETTLRLPIDVHAWGLQWNFQKNKD